MKAPKIFPILLVILFSFAADIYAEVRLPAIIADDMILQRDVELKIWGWADPGEKIEVEFRDCSATTVTDAAGNWQLTLPAQQAGGPDVMRVRGKNEIELRNLLVGDVWLCSGQSNMTHTFVRWQEEYADVIAESENTGIRQFHVPTNPILEGPIADNPGVEWKAANPENLLDFTVVGYALAKELNERYQVPQGLIMSCVGGTRIEAWTSEAGFELFPEVLETVQRNKDTNWVEHVNAEAAADREAAGIPEPADKGLLGDIKWYEPAYDAKNWKRINIPGYWEDQGIRDLNGIVWYRREIEIPESMLGTDASIKLGRIINADEIWVNGVSVGKTTYQYPQRRYTIPAGILKAGKNLVVIKVTNYNGKGGFVPDKPYCIEVGDELIDLKGYWHYKVGEVFVPQKPGKPGINAQEQPTSLYNGMIAPYIDYGIRGILWYQGESNAGNPERYAEWLPNLIHNWRELWGLGELPFLIAQLPNYMDVNYLPEESNWALMREVQLETSRTVANTGLGINIDLGEWNDIHPGKKMEVGHRLALQAMNIAYGDERLLASGPVYSSYEVKRGKIVVHFDPATIGGGLTSLDGEPLNHFAVAGQDGVFHWAEAKIVGDSVEVCCKSVPEPEHVRYAWADNPDFANLGNMEGLPATPFRTGKCFSRPD